MAMLAALVLQAFKKMDRQPVTTISNNKIPLGLRAPVNAVEEKELEQIATLVLKGMINAAKAGNRIGDEETQKVIVRIRMSGSNEDIQQLIFTEMQRPLDLDGLVSDIPNEAVAAQVYAASLFAMEADTSSERRYLEQFVQRTGLDIGVAEHMSKWVGPEIVMTGGGNGSGGNGIENALMIQMMKEIVTKKPKIRSHII